MLDIARLRAETPGVARRTHLNNAGAALMPQPVLDTVKAHLDLEAQIGGYEAKDAERARIDAVYDSVAGLIGARRSEVALVENATVAWDLLFYGLPFQPGDRILTARSEYGANFVAYLQVARRTGAKIEIMPTTPEGEIDPAALERMIDRRAKLISLSWIPTNGGLIQPMSRVGEVARRHGIPFLVDGCQAVGQIPVDVLSIGCDMFAATGRKFLRGPRGTGFLWIHRDFMDRVEPPMLDHFGAEWISRSSYRLRPDARRYETWESSYALHLGLGAAADYAMTVGVRAGSERAIALADRLRDGLRTMRSVTVHDLGRRPGAIVTLSSKRLPAPALKTELAARGINASVSGVESTRLDAEARHLPPLLRLSPHYYNTEREVEDTLAALSDILAI